MDSDEKGPDSESYSDRVKKMRNLIDQAIEEGFISENKFKDLLASSWAEQEILEESCDELLESHKNSNQALTIFAAEGNQTSNKGKMKLLELLSENDNKDAEVILKGIKLRTKEVARKAANALHNQPGGSRDKQRQMRKKWASGKYSTRDICAEKECSALGMSFSAARKALRNTPEPKTT